MDRGTWVLAAAHADHDDEEKEKKAGQSKTHSVDGLIANDNLAVYLSLKARYGRALFTKSRYLWSTGSDQIKQS